MNSGELASVLLCLISMVAARPETEQGEMMKIRIYEVGKRTSGMVLINDFPVALNINEDGRLETVNQAEGCICQLDTVDGQLYFRTHRESPITGERDLAEEGPLQPGDWLRYRDHNYLISYELSRPVHSALAKHRVIDLPDQDLVQLG